MTSEYMTHETAGMRGAGLSGITKTGTSER